jgi:hypothetical protein
MIFCLAIFSSKDYLKFVFLGVGFSFNGFDYLKDLYLREVSGIYKILFDIIYNLLK